MHFHPKGDPISSQRVSVLPTKGEWLKCQNSKNTENGSFPEIGKNTALPFIKQASRLREREAGLKPVI